MSRATPMISTAALSALIAFAFVPIAAAQSRTVPDAPKTPPSTGVPGAGGKGPVPGIPNPGRTTPDGPAGGGSIDGLPDAVTVLDILRQLPRWPGIGPIDTNDGPPDRGPQPQGGKPADTTDAPRAPNRVVTLNPAQPFTPRPSPRGDATPPPVIGGIV
ncbi:MAG: hypothetical protein ABL897_15685, partial [Hyphomicrobium sp.]